jgi:hypothetical protein
MSPRSRHCAATWQTLPELALGIADGEERAVALDHLAGCADCRRELHELSAVTDDLIALAPEREPPAGFEARVLESLVERQAPARPKRRRLKRLSVGFAMVASAAVTAIALVLSYSDDRHLASQYRAALRGGHGQYFQSASLRTVAGKPAGTVFGYEGSPSWMFYVMDGRYRSGLYAEQIVTRTGRSIKLPPFRLVAGSWGIAMPVPLHDIALVRLVRQPNGQALEASLPLVRR